MAYYQAAGRKAGFSGKCLGRITLLSGLRWLVLAAVTVRTICPCVSSGRLTDMRYAPCTYTATCMAFVPGVIFYLSGQKYFVEGIVMTGMKN